MKEYEVTVRFRVVSMSSQDIGADVLKRAVRSASFWARALTEGDNYELHDRRDYSIAVMAGPVDVILKADGTPTNDG